jgi:hypothetical protein
MRIYLYGSKKMENYNWEKFHDWIIGKMNIDWSRGTVLIQLDQVYHCDIVIENFKLVTIPKRLPWGESNYINHIVYLNDRNSGGQLEIEMQSGDVLKFEGGTLTLIE